MGPRRPQGAPEGLTVAPATAEHRDFVRALSAEVFARFGYYDATLPPLIGLPWIRTFVAVAAGLPVGFAMCSLEDAAAGEIDLIAVAVLPEWQARGVGRLLLRHVEEQARGLLDADAPLIRLTVAEDNERARSVFERFGFKTVPDEPGTYPGGQRSVEMRKRLV